MVFNPNIPTPSQKLSVSQPILLSNNMNLDTSFGIDHYAFSDASPNNGFHNKVTTPIFVDSPPSGLPPVTTTDPIFYAFQDTSNLGTLQYSRGPSDAVPTPLTTLFSPSTPLSVGNSSSIQVFDFTGIALSHSTLRYSLTNTVSASPFIVEYLILFETGPITVLSPVSSLGNARLLPTFTGNILSLTAGVSGACTNLFWTLKFHRIQT